MELRDRFLAKVEQGPPDACWEWNGYVGPHGYGSIYRHRPATPVPAHRVSYELFVGPIPEGLHIDHLCRNRRCVNPNHLEAVTPGENARRGLIATRTACAAGHTYTPETTYIHPKGDRRCLVCKRRRDAAYRAKRRRNADA